MAKQVNDGVLMFSICRKLLRTGCGAVAPSLQPFLSDTLQVSVMMLVIKAQVTMCITEAGSNVKIVSGSSRSYFCYLLLLVCIAIVSGDCNMSEVLTSELGMRVWARQQLDIESGMRWLSERTRPRELRMHRRKPITTAKRETLGPHHHPRELQEKAKKAVKQEDRSHGWSFR